jgi:hypothetical protein
MRLLCRAESELLEYLRHQFPATDGHIPLGEKIHAVWTAGWRSGMESAADIVLSRSEQLQRNNCKDTIREHYAEQAIRTAARHNAEAMPRRQTN